MAKLRKMLGDWRGESIQLLMNLIETQSKETLVKWSVGYAERVLLPVFAKHSPNDNRPFNALATGKDWLNGSVKLSAAKPIFKQAFVAAQEADNPVARAAARAIYAAVAAANTPTMSISVAYYGAAAVAYDRVGLTETDEAYNRIAEEVFAELYAELQVVAVENEPNPAKINWNC
jgi:hypothetical protein